MLSSHPFEGFWMDSVPRIFQPLLLRSGIKFRNLRNHRFTREEMEWLCEEMMSNDKQQWPHRLTSPKAISKRYNVHVDGLRFWLSCHRMGEAYSSVEHSRLQQCIQPVLDGISARRIAILVDNSDDVAELDLIALGEVEIEKSAQRRKAKRRRQAMQDSKSSSKRQHN